MTRLQLALIAWFSALYCPFVQSADELKANGTSQQRQSRSHSKWLQSNYNPYFSQNPWLQQEVNHYRQEDRTQGNGLVICVSSIYKCFSIYSDFFDDFQSDDSDVSFRSHQYSMVHLLFYSMCALLKKCIRYRSKRGKRGSFL